MNKINTYQALILILTIQFFAFQVKSADLALAGDSTVATYSASKGKQGWGKNLPLYTKNLNTKNYAVGGRTTKTFREEGYWKKILNDKPTFVFIQFAHNDSSSDPKKHVSISSYKSYLEKYATEARGKNIKPFFVSPPHRCRFSGSKVTQELKPYVVAMKETASKMNVPLLDLYAQTEAYLNAQGKNICKSLFDDETHTNNEGSKKWASFVAAEAKKISELLGFFK